MLGGKNSRLQFIPSQGELISIGVCLHKENLVQLRKKLAVPSIVAAATHTRRQMALEIVVIADCIEEEVVDG